MTKEHINNLNTAFKDYNINDDGDLPNKILKYVYDRIETNRAEIEKVSSIYNSNATCDEILKIVNNEINNDPEQIGKIIIDKQGFLFAHVLMPIGIIAVKAYDSLEIIKYWIKAIKTRNAIAISSEIYNDYSIEALILVILKEALTKFNINENLLAYLPIEDCPYQEFDKVIYTYNDNGEILDVPNVEDISKLKFTSNKKYVYIESKELRKEAEKNTDAEFIEENIDEAISKVKNAKAAVIYTTDSQKAYKFINLACCDNVFVNASLENIFYTIKSENPLFTYRNIITPVPKELINKKKDDVEKNTSNSKNNNQTSNRTSSETGNMMVEYKESLWSKFRKRFKKLFRI